MFREPDPQLVEVFSERLKNVLGEFTIFKEMTLQKDLPDTISLGVRQAEKVLIPPDCILVFFNRFRGEEGNFLVMELEGQQQQVHVSEAEQVQQLAFYEAKIFMSTKTYTMVSFPDHLLESLGKLAEIDQFFDELDGRQD